MQRPPGSSFPGGAGGGFNEQPPTDQDYTYPDYCLIRVIDVTVEPGKTYQYRIQVKMANPNVGHTDVASPGYRVPKPLESDWFTIPDKVTVPPDVHFYAVDQKEVDVKDPELQPKDLTQPRDRRPYKGIHANDNVRPNQTILQIHKWLDTTPLPGSKDQVPIGDWSIAERVFANRGEYAGSEEKVEVPFWKQSVDSFAFVTDPKLKGQGLRGKEPILVSFRDVQPKTQTQTILLDFVGPTVSYEKAVQKKEDDEKTPRGQAVSDKVSTEVLFLTPDGKLLAHDSSADAKDQERVDRHQAWRKWVEDVRRMKDDPNRVNPLGGIGGGAGGGDGPGR
jgi:hypothetical protein